MDNSLLAVRDINHKYIVVERTDYMDKMDYNAHSVYLMYYHLIMVVKYRRKVIDDPISERAKEIWERIAPDYGITLEDGRKHSGTKVSAC